MKYTVLYIFFFILFVFIHYIEGITLMGSLSMAQLWKIPLLAFLIFKCVSSIRRRASFEKFGCLFSLETLLSPETIVNPTRAIVKFSKQLPLILFFGYWMGYFRGKARSLETILYAFAQFTILSALLVFLGIVEPLKAPMSADAIIDGGSYFTGIFLTPHSAASYFSIALLILIHGIKTKYFHGLFQKTFNLFLVGVGLYSLFQAYVRTGWLMFMVSLLAFFNLKRITYKQLLTLIISLFVAVGSLTYLFNNNEAFHARMTGQNKYTGSGGSNIELEGSGRTDFWKTGLTNYVKNDLYRLVFGSGFTKVAKDNLKENGNPVFSHSQFVDALVQHGIVGLILLLCYYKTIYSFIRKFGRGSPYQNLSYSIFWGGIVFATFQEEYQFNYAFLFSIVLFLMYTIKVSNTSNISNHESSSN